MNRRKAVRNLLIATGLVAVVPGYKWYSVTSAPDAALLQQFAPMIAELAETIIPATTTPGAREAGVGAYIVLMLADATDNKTVNNFIAGLNNVNSSCRTAYGADFIQCSPAQREEVLLKLEQSDKSYNGIAGKVQRRLLGKPFFETLKALTVRGYATSQLGATRGFAYDFIPATFNACVPLQPGQRSWATK